MITSPPYVDLLDYIENDITPISQFFNLGEINDLQRKSIGYRDVNDSITENLYYIKMDRIFQEIYRILRPDSHFIIVIGIYKNMKEMYNRLSKINNFLIERILTNEMINNKRRKNYEHIIFLKKG